MFRGIGGRTSTLPPSPCDGTEFAATPGLPCPPSTDAGEAAHQVAPANSRAPTIARRRAPPGAARHRRRWSGSRVKSVPRVRQSWKPSRLAWSSTDLPTGATSVHAGSICGRAPVRPPGRAWLTVTGMKPSPLSAARKRAHRPPLDAGAPPRLERTPGCRRRSRPKRRHRPAGHLDRSGERPGPLATLPPPRTTRIAARS